MIVRKEKMDLFLCIKSEHGLWLRIKLSSIAKGEIIWQHCALKFCTDTAMLRQAYSTGFFIGLTLLKVSGSATKECKPKLPECEVKLEKPKVSKEASV